MVVQAVLDQVVVVQVVLDQVVLVLQVTQQAVLLPKLQAWAVPIQVVKIESFLNLTDQLHST